MNSNKSSSPDPAKLKANLKYPENKRGKTQNIGSQKEKIERKRTWKSNVYGEEIKERKRSFRIWRNWPQKVERLIITKKKKKTKERKEQLEKGQKKEIKKRKGNLEGRVGVGEHGIIEK